MSADWLPNLLLAWGVQRPGVFSPGPGVALILSAATSAGLCAALTTCLGIGAGAVVLAIATVVGLAAVLSEIARATTLLKLAGAAYLASLAFGSFHRALNPPPPPSAARTSGRGRMAAAEFAMQTTNPKAIFFWLAVAALGNLDTAPLPIIAVFVAGAFLNSFCGHGAGALAPPSRPFLAIHARMRRWIEGALDAFFAFAAFKLATARS